MICVLQPVKALVGNVNQLIGLVSILWKRGDAVVHANAHTHLKLRDRFRKNSPNSAAESQSLRGVGLREKKCELVAADSKRRVRSSQGFLQSCGSGAEDFVAARMTMLVVDFLEAVQIENDEAERLAVAASAI